MVDLHCHILPDCDDGAEDLDEALAMSRLAVADGITDLVATPHAQDGLHDNNRLDVRSAVERLQAELDRQGIPLRLHPGMEVHMHVELLDNLGAGQLLTLCDRHKHLLLELPALSIPSCTEAILYELQVLGVTPIIAHPERNLALQEHPERLAEWVADGCAAQLTGGSLFGKFGRAAQRAAEQMVRHDWVHLIASDGHSAERRRPQLGAAYERLAQLTSRNTMMMYRERALAVVRGEHFQIAEPQASGMKKRRRWL
jgi:protein-tyrosine phosphatase